MKPSPEQYVGRAAADIYALTHEDAPHRPSDKPLGYFGPYAEAIKTLREFHAQVAQLSARNGKAYDVWGDARMVWEGLRSGDDGSKQYGLLDQAMRQIGYATAEEAPPAPAKAKPQTEYITLPEKNESAMLIDRLTTLGFTFRLNLCGGMIEVNGKPIDEIVQAEVRVALRDVGLHKKISAAEDAYIAEAKKNSYHPVREYLDTLVWDGADHITALTRCMYSSDPAIVYAGGVKAPLHHVYVYRWLIGAVAKVYTGAQNAMLVLDGPQGCGKSTLAHWLCPLPAYFIEGAISVGDKDSLVRLASTWIWEVAELDATTRKADQSALKDFITKEVIVVRKAYGRADWRGPAMASLIGTLNNTSGFLADESGSRRFMITKIDRIDLAYQKIDVAQLWAQAVVLYREGQAWQLQGEEATAQGAVNEGYEVSTTLTDWLDRTFDFRSDYDTPYSLADIISAMEADGFRISGSERSQAMELSRVLTRRHCRVVHTRLGNRWIGLYKIPKA